MLATNDSIVKLLYKLNKFEGDEMSKGKVDQKKLALKTIKEKRREKKEKNQNKGKVIL